MRRCVAALVVIVWSMVHGVSGAATVTFDNVTSGTAASIPNTYGGFLSWSNFWVGNARMWGGGYYRGLVSGDYIAYNNGGGSAMITGSAFNVVGAFFSAAWRDGLTLTIEGYRGTSRASTRTVVLNTTELSWVALNFTDVTTMSFTAQGGTRSPGASLDGTQFAMDNLQYSFSSSPTVVTLPAIMTLSAESVGHASATLRGLVTSDGEEACQYQFRYKPSGGAYTTTSWAGSVTTGQTVSQAVTDLTPTTTYLFNAKTRNTAGESAWGSDQTFVTTAPAVQRTLTTSCTSGGSVTTPGVGSFQYDQGTQVSVVATPAASYRFVNWTGTVVTSRRIARPLSASTTVTMDADYTLRANFERLTYVLYVGNVANGDDTEDGTADHPFDTIQEAIDAAGDGCSIRVMPGVYGEKISFGGKRLEVTNADPNAPGVVCRTVLDANGLGPAVTFDHGEDANCVLRGFTITGGHAEAGGGGGGLRCYGSSPTISNCLIVGNRASRFDGGGVDCFQSQATFLNCTIAGNAARHGGGGLTSDQSQIKLVNCIVWGNAPDQIQVLSGTPPTVGYCNIQAGWPGEGNVDADPCFAALGQWGDADGKPASPLDLGAHWVVGDYHLRSQEGRYDVSTEGWVKDTSTSPCIDAGDPDGPIGTEPFPNGKRINMGAFGGTPDASKTVRLREPIYEFNLDANPGWDTRGEWQYGPPQGLGGANGNPDPNSGYTGPNVYGVNLRGDYRVAVGGPYYLTTGSFDCRGYERVHLKFARWLNSDFSEYVANTVEVSADGQTWQVIWQPEPGVTTSDSAWQTVEYDIGSWADDRSGVRLRWGYAILNSRAYPYSGWNIDDIEMTGINKE